MKKIVLLGALFITITLCASAQKSNPLHWYPFQKKVTETVTDGRMKTEMAFKDSTLFFAPSVSFDVFSKEKDTGDYSLGVIPGVGYGLKWNPFKWQDNYLLGIDLFAQAALSGADNDAKYFNIRMLPTITLLNWIHVGYGAVWKVGLNGNPNINTSVFSIGISKSL